MPNTTTTDHLKNRWKHYSVSCIEQVQRWLVHASKLSNKSEIVIRCVSPVLRKLSMSPKSLTTSYVHVGLKYSYSSVTTIMQQATSLQRRPNRTSELTLWLIITANMQCATTMTTIYLLTNDHSTANDLKQYHNAVR